MDPFVRTFVCKVLNREQDRSVAIDSPPSVPAISLDQFKAQLHDSAWKEACSAIYAQYIEGTCHGSRSANVTVMKDEPVRNVSSPVEANQVSTDQSELKD